MKNGPEVAGVNYEATPGLGTLLPLVNQGK